MAKGKLAEQLSLADDAMAAGDPLLAFDILNVMGIPIPDEVRDQVAAKLRDRAPVGSEVSVENYLGRARLHLKVKK